MDLIDRELVPTGLLPSPVQLVRKGESISSNDGLRQLIREILPAPDFEGLDVHFECVATNIDDAVEHWFHKGDLVRAVLASASIPAVFPPVEIDGVHYLDGGIVDDVPVQRAVELGATRIFVLQVGAVDRPRPDPRRPIDVAMLAYWIARRHRLLEDLARIPEDVEVVILPHGNAAPVRYNDLSSSAHLMDAAYRASSAHLDARIAGDIPPSLGPLRDRSLTDAPGEAGSQEQAELESARKLFAATRATLGLGEGSGRAAREAEPRTESRQDADAIGPDGERPDGEGPDGVEPDGEGPDTRSRLLERAESLGPAMRALVDRMLERGGFTGIRTAEPESDDGDDSADEAADPQSADGDIDATDDLRPRPARRSGR